MLDWLPSSGTVGDSGSDSPSMLRKLLRRVKFPCPRLLPKMLTPLPKLWRIGRLECGPNGVEQVPNSGGATFAWMTLELGAGELRAGKEFTTFFEGVSGALKSIGPCPASDLRFRFDMSPVERNAARSGFAAGAMGVEKDSESSLCSLAADALFPGRGTPTGRDFEKTGFGRW